MGEQIDTINKAKAKCEKDKATVECDLSEARNSWRTLCGTALTWRRMSS